MIYRYFIELSYKGTAFHGWQKQPNAKSVQETLENAFSLLLKSETQIVGCGRTDTGVHAKYYVAHFDLEAKLEHIPVLIKKINSFLSHDIVILSITNVSNELHARFSAIEREYEYHILCSKDPFLKDFSHRIYFDADFELMNETAKTLFKHNDFTSFSKLHTDVKTNNCTIIEAKWVQLSSDHWVFHIRADRFLRNMVRAIVGTLLEVGKGKMTIAAFEDVILAKDRSKAGVSVPGEALFLSDVKYPEELFLRQAD